MANAPDPLSQSLVHIYRNDGEIFVLCAVAVAVYAGWLFYQPTRQLTEHPELDPPKKPRLLTTRVRYLIGVSLYVMAWLCFYAAFAIWPKLLLVITEYFKIGTDIAGKVSRFSSFMLDNGIAPSFGYPILAAVLAIGLSRLWPFSRVEEELRSLFNGFAAIPVKAFLMRNDLLARDLRCVEIAEAALPQPLPNLAREQPDLFRRYVKLNYLGTRLRAWQRDPDYGPFALKYGAEWRKIADALADLQARVRMTESILDLQRRLGDGAAPTGVPADGRLPGAANLDDQLQAISATVTTILRSLATFLICAVLLTFATERCRNEALYALGFDVPRVVRVSDWPLDWNELAITGVGVFIITLLSTLMIGIMPARWFGNDALPMDATLAFTSVMFSASAVAMHIIAVLAAIGVRRWLANTPIGHAIDRHDTPTTPVAMYLVLGLIGFAWGGMVAILVRYLQTDAVFPWALSWGAVTFVTAASVGYHQDRAYRFLAHEVGVNVRLFGRGVSHRTVRSTVQALLTIFMCLLANFLVVEALKQAAEHAATVSASVNAGAAAALNREWLAMSSPKWILFLVVCAGAIGGFLGYHLPINFRRRQQAKHANGGADLFAGVTSH